MIILAVNLSLLLFLFLFFVYGSVVINLFWSGGRYNLGNGTLLNN